jgi:hypothetical protein
MKFKFEYKDKHIIDVIDNLDVHKIHSVMGFLKWRWRGEPVSMGNIYSELMSRLNDTVNRFEGTEYDNVDKVYYCSDSGGIKIEIFLDESNDPYISVSFVITQWDTAVCI